MTKNVVIYARVSSEIQDTDDKVSIESQIETAENLAKQNDWNILQTFIDNKRYKKTKPPKIGKVVQPSGEYDDRPGFLAMLELIETGQVDVVVYYDLYRFGRHHRVLGTFLTTIDEANKRRKEPVEIWEAAFRKMASNLELGIMVTIGQEENATRVRRSKMGKIGTLKNGRWPGTFECLGYDTRREEGKRGREIFLADREEVKAVEDIFNWYDYDDMSSVEIRNKLRALGVKQKTTGNNRKHREHDWNHGIIVRMLRNEAYIGRATWTFGDGEQYTIEIPRIVSDEQFERVQRKLSAGVKNSPRNTQGIYILQNVLYCGECDGKMLLNNDRYHYRRLANGKMKRYNRKTEKIMYYCAKAAAHSHEPHPRPYSFPGRKLEYKVWRFVADKIIANPVAIIEQVKNRQVELRVQGDNLDSEIGQKQKRLAEIAAERKNYLRQQARGFITEKELEEFITELDKFKSEVEQERDELLALRDKEKETQDAIDNVEKMLEHIQTKMPEIDYTQEDFELLSKDLQEWILQQRKEIIEALCEKIYVCSDGGINIGGLIDSDSVKDFVNPGLATG